MFCRNTLRILSFKLSKKILRPQPSSKVNRLCSHAAKKNIMPEKGYRTLHITPTSNTLESGLTKLDTYNKKKVYSLKTEVFDKLLETKALDYNLEWDKIRNAVKNKYWPIQLMSLIADYPENEECERMGYSLYNYINNVSEMEYIKSNQMFWLVYSVFLSQYKCPEDGLFKLLREKWENYDQIELLDTKTGKWLIQLYCNTSQWKKSLHLLDLVTEYNHDNVLDCFRVVMRRALLDNDQQTVFKLLEMYPGLNGTITIFDDIFQSIEGNNRLLNKILFFLQRQRWIVSNLNSERIHRCFNAQKWKSEWSYLTNRGKCTNCGFQLNKLAVISDEDFSTLKDTFYSKILIQGDIFRNTTPEELETFTQFLQKNPKFDIIVDALNVAYKTRTGFLDYSNIIETVKHLALEKKLRVLVIGRAHINNKRLSSIRQIASFFFTSDISKDDPFMLYAAFMCGKETLICTSDHLRKESVMLGRELRELFFYWQRGHQVFITYQAGDSKLRFRWPNNYDQIIHRDENSWHIPYHDNQKRAIFETGKTMLCIRKL